MTIYELTQKRNWMETFNCVTALYYILKANSTALRVKQATYHAGEIQAQPVDFIIDVELKAKRLLGEPIYNVFLRAVYNENLELLPEYTREALGRTLSEYGLGPEGTYAKLYFSVKNEQVRSYMKGHNAGDTNSTSGATESIPTYVEQNNDSTGVC